MSLKTKLSLSHENWMLLTKEKPKQEMNFHLSECRKIKMILRSSLRVRLRRIRDDDEYSCRMLGEVLEKDDLWLGFCRKSQKRNMEI